MVAESSLILELAEAFAESLTERPQQVDPVLTVAPEGWTTTAYKEDRIVQFTGDGDESMTVVLLDDLSPGLGRIRCNRREQRRSVVRAAAIGRKDGEGWVLEAQTADGTPFSLQAPVNFSKEQVVEVANAASTAAEATEQAERVGRPSARHLLLDGANPPLSSSDDKRALLCGPARTARSAARSRALRVMGIMGWSTTAMAARYQHVTDPIRRDVASCGRSYLVRGRLG